jgi:hypothetical protein
MFDKVVTKLPRKIANLCWDGFVLHPFLVQLDISLAENGFRFKEHDLDAACSVWEKEIFQDHALEISIWPERSKPGKGSYSFEVGLSVASRRQAALEEFLDIASCYEPQAIEEENVSTQKVERIGLLSSSFNWLIARWPPAVGSFAEAFDRWRNLKNDDYQRHVDDFMHFYRNQGLAFIELIDSREKLAGVLTQLDSFPGAGAGSSPGSASPWEYAAVLYADSGRRADALRELEKIVSSSKARSVNQQNIAQCVFERYRSWINKS